MSAIPFGDFRFVFGTLRFGFRVQNPDLRLAVLAVRFIRAIRGFYHAKSNHLAFAIEVGVERKNATPERSCIVNGATVVGTEEPAMAVHVPQHHNPATRPERDEGFRLPRQIDFVTINPLDEVPHREARVLDDALEIRVSEGQEGISAAIAATGATEAEQGQAFGPD